MLSRAELIGSIVDRLGEHDRLVTALGYLTREAYAQTAAVRERCFYCYGSMGSVVPFSLGLALARPDLNFWAVEGDGSLLMNLGACVTLRRYGGDNVCAVIADNRCYESTGGQPSQPDGFQLAAVCRAIGLATCTADSESELRAALDAPVVSRRVIVARLSGEPGPPRANEDPVAIAKRFRAALTA